MWQILTGIRWEFSNGNNLDQYHVIFKLIFMLSYLERIILGFDRSVNQL